MDSKECMELVHSDLCGPINQPSNGGKRYFMTFINHYSQKTGVYFLQKKKLKYHKETGKSIKIFCSDRNGEYNSQKFVSFVRNMEFRSNLQQFIYHSRMVFQRGRIV